MLKDLSSSLSKHHIDIHTGNVDKTRLVSIIKDDIDNTRRDTYRDTDIACDVIGHIFHSIDICLEEDKSKVKLSTFTKSFIKGVLTSNVKTGIINFVKNMSNRDIKILLDNIQGELDKRK